MNFDKKQENSETKGKNDENIEEEKFYIIGNPDTDMEQLPSSENQLNYIPSQLQKDVMKKEYPANEILNKKDNQNSLEKHAENEEQKYNTMTILNSESKKNFKNEEFIIDFKDEQKQAHDKYSVIKKIIKESNDANFIEIIEQTSNNPFKDRSLGCIAGAFIGDSIGSYLEFSHNPTKITVDNAMTMSGGGTFSLNPGQITDDSEIALCLAKGLYEGNGKMALDKIAYYYGFWINSRPFDLGSTIGAAFYPLKDLSSNQFETLSLSHMITNRSFRNNMDSQSNGSLMRITPLAVWCQNLSEKDIEEAVKLEIKHTHHNPILIEASILWVLAIVKLIKYEDDQILDEETNIKNRMKYVYSYIKSKIEASDKFSPEIKEWWKQVEEEKFMKADVRMGWVKIAWTYGFIYLKKQETNYDEVIRSIIQQGGDTDTNACIVGGMIGSAIGLKRINPDFIKTMVFCNCNDVKSYNRRDPFFNPINGLKLGNSLFNLAPKTLEVIIKN